jgi:hypothetical protein
MSLWDIYSVTPIEDSELNYKRVTYLVAVELRNITNEPIYDQVYKYCDFPK